MAYKTRGLGGGRGPVLGGTSATNNTRGNTSVLLPSGGFFINKTSQDDILTPTEDLLLQPEDLWLDLASDMSRFIELDQIPEVIQEEKKEVVDAAESSLILPHLVRDLGLRDEQDEMDQMQAANMKILDQYRNILEGDCSFDDDDTVADDSMDSFASDLDSNQSLIEEVESYLQGMSGGAPTILLPEDFKEVDVKEMTAVVPAVTRKDGVIRKQQQQQRKINEEDNSRILKAMVEGKVLATADSFEDSFTSSCGSFELSEEDLVNAYTTTIKTENGQDVIIIIAQPNSPASRYVPDMVSSPTGSLGSPAYASSSCSDYEWSPSPQQQAGQRKKYQRKNRPTLLSQPYPRDKVERKKAQNRTAAFRYREKKKAEQDAWDEEIRQLEERNTALKARLRHMEQELSCVKRLMVDTGLGHFIAAGP